MSDINNLLKKYYKPEGYDLTRNQKINPAEKMSNEYHNKIRSENRRKHRHLILDELLTEIPFHLTKTQILQIRYWIDRFNDEFKSFNRKSSNETIILAFILIQRKQDKPRLNISKLSITRKYKLTQAKFTTIQNRLIFQLMRTTELKYTQSKYYNHEILKKEA